MPFSPSVPYNDLPRLPPREDIETKAVLKACIEARAALAELKGAGDLIPNQNVLINAMPLLEAQASSEIENIVTTADQLFQYADQPGEGADAATKEALRYRTALFEGVGAIGRKPLSMGTAIDVCSRIKGAEMEIRSRTGTALANEGTGEVIYTPPEGRERIIELLKNWEAYMHEENGLDPLIRMAVSHYQFEAIHPFSDGNGRTGRVLNLLILIDRRLLSTPILYLSRYIIRTKMRYYQLLLEVTRHAAWEAWVLYMLEAVRETARSTSAKISEIRMLIDETAEKVRDEASNIYSRELVELVFEQPYCRISDVVSKGLAQRQTASERLKRLAEIGVLEERKAGREKLFVNPAFINALVRAT